MNWKTAVAVLSSAVLIFGAAGEAMAASSPASKLPAKPGWAKSAEKSSGAMSKNRASIEGALKSVQDQAKGAFDKQQKKDKQLKPATKFDGTYVSKSASYQIAGAQLSGQMTVKYRGNDLVVAISGEIEDAVYLGNGNQIQGHASGTMTVTGPVGEVTDTFSAPIVLDVKTKKVVREPISPAQVLIAYAPIDQPEIQKPTPLPQPALDIPEIKKLPANPGDRSAILPLGGAQ